ncbi:MAG TPA: hypothetical protein VLL54_09405 [Pyrinomonadaceae bacterium]|nr:hypothetical protein [Pyrinomonadaceae bacterium]
MISLMKENRLIVFCLTLATAASFACAARRSAGAEPVRQLAASPSSPAPSPPATGTAPATLTSTATSERPRKDEVQQAIQRIYKDAVVIQEDRGGSYFTGDFNADGSPDLAVIVKPAKGGLPKLNSEYANWILEDPRKVRFGQTTKPQRETVAEGELLLIVLHGFQETGWRHKYARQSYLLRNSVGENLRTQSSREAGQEKRFRDAPAAQTGVVISEKLAGREGFIYWNNSRYAWSE